MKAPDRNDLESDIKATNSIATKKSKKVKTTERDHSPIRKTFSITKYQEDYLILLMTKKISKLKKNISLSEILRSVIDQHLEGDI